MSKQDKQGIVRPKKKKRRIGQFGVSPLKMGAPPGHFGTGIEEQYTPEMAKKICELVTSGWKMRHILALPDLPNQWLTIWRWRQSHPEFDKAYLQARVDRIGNMAEEIEEISDDGTNDFNEREILLRNGNIKKVDFFDHEHVQRSNLRVNTRKWLLEKVYPKLYGQKPAGDEVDPLERARQLREAVAAMKGASDAEPGGEGSGGT